MSDAQAKRNWRGWVWIERAVWVFVLVILLRRFGPQIGSVVGIEDDLGALPEFSLVTLNGDSVSLADFKGKVVLVNFWASWCSPCRIEMPGFQRVYEDKKDDGFVILGLATDRDRHDVDAFLAEHEVTYPVALAPEHFKQAMGGIHALPTSFLVDRDGVIRHRVYGFYAPPALRMAVSRMLAEAEP